MQLISIGRFSRLTGLTVKALRFYDKINLLPPKQVDEDSSFRYYSHDQIQKAITIRKLRGLGVPLPVIRRIAQAEDSQSLVAQLRPLVQERELWIAEMRSSVAGLKKTVAAWEGARTHDVVVRREDPRDALTMSVSTSLENLLPAICECLTEMEACASKQGLLASGPPFVIYTDGLDVVAEGSSECCYPITGEAVSCGRVTVQHLPGGLVFAARHEGSWEEIRSAYTALDMWVSLQGRQMDGPPWEVLLTDPRTTPPNQLLTEAVWPIA